MNIAVDAYFYNNLGDDLFLKILIERFPTATFYFILKKKEHARYFSGFPNVQFTSRVGLFYNLRHFDGYVYIGGSLFQEHENWKKQKFIFKLTVELFSLFKKKTYVLGCNFGPFHSPNFLTAYKKIFKKLTQLTVRDEWSYDLLNDGQINIAVYPDIVLSMKIEQKYSENTIGLCMMDIQNSSTMEFNHYLNFFEKIIFELLKNNKKIRIFSFQNSDMINDAKVAQKILDTFSADTLSNIELIEYNDNLDLFLEKYSQCTSILTTRFHSMILAIICKQNFVAISYDKKIINTLKMLNLKNENVYSMSELSENNIQIVINQLSKQPNNDMSLQEQELRKIQNDAEQHFYELDKLIE